MHMFVRTFQLDQITQHANAERANGNFEILARNMCKIQAKVYSEDIVFPHS